jgi:hypothetical protein
MPTAQKIPGPSLYLTGGRQKPRKDEDWNAYDKSIVLHLNTTTGEITTAVEYVSPMDACAGPEASMNFKSAMFQGNRMVIATNTEVLIYETPSFRQIGYVSLPWFNDVHFARLARNGNLLVVSTGLDMVGEATLDGCTIRQWSVLGDDTWQRFSKDTDYRKVITTQPHKSHPNYVLEAGDDIWVGRSVQKDTYCLTTPDRRVPFVAQPHDGVQFEGKVYFTTVNGFIHILDEKTMTMADTIDLNQIEPRDVDLGWMRGIFPMGDGLCWVGFTRLRPTKFRQNLSWVKHGFKQYRLPTRISLYDLKNKKILQDIDIEPYGINAVFSILPEPNGSFDL